MSHYLLVHPAATGGIADQRVIPPIKIILASCPEK
jgi:hypothetical protein